MNKNILILGSDGMVGRTIFLSLQSIYPGHVWGTTRNKKNIAKQKLFLAAETHQKDLTIILRRLKKIDYVINCIALLNPSLSLKDAIYTNAFFPHLLEEEAEKNNFRLIHLSTDAVFSPDCGEVTEVSPPSPTDPYGMTKLLGETSSNNALTFRSSFLGFDPEKQKGLLENIRSAKGPVYGYTNQIWTGCTALQIAELCKAIIIDDAFITLRKKNNIYHFAPLGPISKYSLIKSFLITINAKKMLKKTKNKKKKRILKTIYAQPLFMHTYAANIEQAFQDLLIFENTHT